MKKIAMLVLVLALCLSIATPAMANVTITYGDGSNNNNTSTGGGQDSTMQGSQTVSGTQQPVGDIVPGLAPSGQGNVSIRFSFSGGMLRGLNTQQTVTLWTTGIPDGTLLPLSMSDSNGLWIPSAVTIMNGTATFTMFSTSMQSSPTYTITASYRGVNYSSSVAYSAPGVIDVSGNTNEYIRKIEVMGRISGVYDETKDYYDNYVTIVVTTHGVPDGVSLNPTVNGGLTVRDSAVHNDTAVVRVFASKPVPDGTYIITFDYNGNKTSADVIVGNGYGASYNEQERTTVLNLSYFDRIIQGHDLSANRYSQTWIAINTVNIPNGTKLEPLIEGGLVLSQKEHIVQNNQIMTLVTNQGDVGKGEYRFRVSYGGSIAEAYIIVSDGSGTNYGQTYSLNKDINSTYFESVSQSNVILPVVDASAYVTIKTKNVHDGYALIPWTNNAGLVLDKAEYLVENNSVQVKITNKLGLASGTYTLTFSVAGDVQTFPLIVNFGNQIYAAPGGLYSGNAKTTSYITSILADTNILEDGASANVSLITSGIPDGTTLYPMSSSGKLTASVTATVNNDRASFTVTNNEASHGEYAVRILYQGQTAEISFLVPKEAGSLTGTGNSTAFNPTASANSGQTYFTDIIPGAALTAGISGSSSFILRSSAPDGTRLDLQLPDGFDGSISTLEGGEAIIRVSNREHVAAGTYNASVSYRGLNSSAAVPFRIQVAQGVSGSLNVDGLNPFITNVTINPSELNAGVARDVQIVIHTSGIYDGTRLYPMVNGSGFSWNPSRGIMVTNNRAVFTITQKTDTPAGTYTVMIPYSKYVTEAVLTVR